MFGRKRIRRKLKREYKARLEEMGFGEFISEQTGWDFLIDSVLENKRRVKPFKLEFLVGEKEVQATKPILPGSVARIGYFKVIVKPCFECSGSGTTSYDNYMPWQKESCSTCYGSGGECDYRDIYIKITEREDLDSGIFSFKDILKDDRNSL